MCSIALRWAARLALLLLVLLAMPSRAETDPLRLDPQLHPMERRFEGHLQAYHDVTGQLTQKEVASPPYAQQFELLEGGFNGGYSKGAWWIRFEIQTPSKETATSLQESWWLRLNAPYADYIDVWLPAAKDDRNGGLVHRQLGGMRPGAIREMPWSLPVVRLPDLPDAQPHRVWVRLAGDRALSLLGGVSTLREVAGVQQEIAFAAASIVGMVLLMGLVSLMMGMALPERRLIGYAGYLFTLALLFASAQNLPAALWFSDHPVAAVRLHSVSVCLHMVAAFAFARSVLDMARQFPRGDRVFALLTLVCGVACLMAAAGWYGHIAMALHLLWMVFALSVVSLCVVLLRRNSQAWPSLVGYAVYLVLSTQYFAKNLLWLPYTLTTEYSYAIGAIVHILALFFALGWRVRRRERRALALSQQQGERLERRVNDRTHALRQEIVHHEHTHEQLALALREQQGLIAMVSHEFRTPLGTIAGTAEILSDQRLDLARDDVRREAAKITRTVLRMRDLVDTLLADEWLEASSENLSLASIELAHLVREKIDEHNSGNACGCISLSVAESGLSVLADETLLHIAVDNLLSNAIKYAPANSPVSVWVGRQPEAPSHLRDATAATPAEVCIRVSDQGPGFLPQDLPHIFERFYRAAGVRRIPGIGLGLHMVHRIARVHRGTVVAANQPEGGAVLTLFLPLSTTPGVHAGGCGHP